MGTSRSIVNLLAYFIAALSRVFLVGERLYIGRRLRHPSDRSFRSYVRKLYRELSEPLLTRYSLPEMHMWLQFQDVLLVNCMPCGVSIRGRSLDMSNF